jgi:hypothetical protein
LSPSLAEALFILVHNNGSSFAAPKSAKTNNNPLLTGQKDHSSQQQQPQPSDTEWGLDTVTLWFYADLSLCEANADLWSSNSSGNYADSHKSFENYVLYVEYNFATVRVSLDLKSGKCRITFNAARLITGRSRQLLMPGSLEPLVEGILRDLSSHVWPVFDRMDEHGTISRDSDWAKQLRVSRLDPARNLFIEDLHTLKQTLIHTKAKNGKTKQLIWNDKQGWTLYNKTSSQGSDRIYDKSAELACNGFDEEMDQVGHWFRFEIQLQNERLKKYGFYTLDDITDEATWEALVDRWEKCGWGVSLPEPNKLGVVLEALSNTDQSGLLTLLTAQALDIPVPISPSTHSKFRKLAKKHGLTPGMALNLLGPATNFLSLQEGKVIPLGVSEENTEPA